MNELDNFDYVFEKSKNSYKIQKLAGQFKEKSKNIYFNRNEEITFMEKKTKNIYEDLKKEKDFNIEKVLLRKRVCSGEFTGVDYNFDVALKDKEGKEFYSFINIEYTEEQNILAFSFNYHQPLNYKDEEKNEILINILRKTAIDVYLTLINEYNLKLKLLLKNIKVIQHNGLNQKLNFNYLKEINNKTEIIK